jgi:beta-glucosidase
MEFTGLVVTDALIMEGVLAGGESAAVVRALAAGCDCLLYPANIAESEQAILQAIEEKRLDAESVHQSIERRRRWARWASLSRDTNRPARDESGWASHIAEEVVHSLRDKVPRLPQPWNLVIVDDDLGGPYPPPSREPFVSALRTGGVEVVTSDAPPTTEPGATVIALFGDIRAWKGRPGFSSGAREAVRRALQESKSKDRLIVQFSHPRLADELDVDAPIICAWGGEAVMQRAAARVMLRELTTGAEKKFESATAPQIPEEI